MFSQKLKELRSQKGFTQKQIAQEMDIPQQSIARWESGKSSPTLTTLEKFAEFFDTPVENLIADTSISIEKILSADTITFQEQELNLEKLEQVKTNLTQLTQLWK